MQICEVSAFKSVLLYFCSLNKSKIEIVCISEKDYKKKKIKFEITIQLQTQ